MSARKWLKVECTYCEARVNKLCRTRTTGRITGTHMARINTWQRAYNTLIIALSKLCA